ncbi:MAG: class I SAM-dependent methyltransferase [Gemmatimonadetes bacterium]|nr:class I SAM-dependent methyltransferase [Gemmatimonadota bacterium]
MRNVEPNTVRDFGREWEEFSQESLSEEELRRQFDRYFSVFPWDALPESPVGFDMGCGSGRWARFVAPRVGQLHCIDASERALEVARRNLEEHENCRFIHASVEDAPLPDIGMDFGYSLGVLHHVPDTLAGIRSCVAKLKPGAPFLAYLYYAFDNRPVWFRAIWRCSDLARRVISRFPFRMKLAVSFVIASFVYLPLARLSRFLEARGVDVDNIPLSFYRDFSFYSLRTDALDRFGTRLEHRFSRDEISQMFREAGLGSIAFREDVPYWCVVGFRRS